MHCPVIRGARALEQCLLCPRFESLGVGEQDPLVQCRPGTSGLPAGTSLAEALTATACGELLRSEVKCLDSGLEAAEAARFLHSPCVQCGAVVDDRGVFIGIVEVEALERTCADPRLAAEAEVEDAMTNPRVALGDSASVAEALRLMARLGLASLPVVSQDQRVVGMLTAMDLVRWLGERLG